MQPSITCPKCGMISQNPNDVEHRYCGNCHAFHATLSLPDCPTCGADTVNVTCLDDTHFKYLCVECSADIAGEPIPPTYAAAERAKFEALCETIRRADRGE